MKVNHFGSINRTLFILVLVTILPVMAILLYSGFEHRKMLVADAKKDIFLMTTSMVEVQKDLTNNVRQTLSVLSLLTEIQSLDGKKINAILKSIVWKNKEFHNIALVDLDGNVIATALPYTTEIHLGERKHIRDAIETKNFSVGEFSLGKIGSDSPVFPYAYPVFDEKRQLIALLSATIKIEHYTDLHKLAILPENSFIAVTDGNGIRLFYYPEKVTNPIGQPIPASVWSRAQKQGSTNNQGSFSGLGADGLPRLVAYEQIRLSSDSNPYMYVWAGVPENNILRPAQKALVRNMLLLLGSMMLSFVIFLFVGKKVLIEPINRLVDLTKKIAADQLKPCLEPSTGPDELRVLNNAFFDMATQLTNSQQTVHENEFRFKEIFSNMTNGVIILEATDVNDDFVVKDINPAGVNQSPYSRDEILGKSIFTALPQLFDNTFLELLQRVYLTEVHEHYPITKFENVSIQLWIESYVFKLPTGEVVVVYDDVTERKQNEEERFRSEAKFRAVIDQTSDGIYVVGDEGKILLCNRSAYESLGYSEEELLLLSLADVDPGFGKRDDKKDLWQPLQIGDASIVESFHQSKNGRIFPVEVQLSRISMDGQDVMLGIARDISSRKEFEASLKRSKEEWENTFNAMDDIITIQDRNMNIIQANKAFYDAFPDFLIDTPKLPLCYKIFHSDKQICESCPAHRTFSDGNIHREDVGDEGTGKTYSVSTCPILSEDGSFEHIVHIVKDITDSKRLEEELFQSHKMEAIGTLAGGIAHDFNNILSAIMGYAEFIKEDAPASGQIGADAEEILRATNRAKDLVKQILTFSRKNDQMKTVIEPHFVILEALQMLRSTMPVSIRMEEDIQIGCGPILANTTNLHQVVLNLCANARHAMIEDKGVIKVALKRVERLEEQLPHEKDLQPGNFVELVITDNGCGMCTEDLERIFEPYYTTREVGAGSGLGLSVTHGIVEDCNGYIEVESRVGEGTSFSVYFPCCEVDADVDNTTLVEKASVQIETAGHILLVDDEPLLLDINSRRLQQLGYQVVMTESSKDALDWFMQDPNKFDLLITDQTMPELTGEDLAREVLQCQPAFPIIVCTGHSESFTEEKALAMGIKKYVLKPVFGDELMNAVGELLGS